MFLKSFEYYRGIAIILIITGHCYWISGWNFASYPERVLANIITGGTSLFVFISGFLFHQVFYPRFRYSRFMQKKLMKVFLPYLFWSILALLLTYATHIPLPGGFVGPTPSFWDQYLQPIVLSLITGGHFLAYWYIPFIMIIFMLSPLFIGFIELRRQTQLLTTILFLCAALLIQRPVNNILVIQSVLFFTPVYFFGILCSINRDWIYAFLGPKIWWLGAGVLLLSLIQSSYYMGAGSYHKPLFILHGVDINLVQKFLLCLLAMLILHRFENTESRILSNLAGSSFALFFIHGWVIKVLTLIKTSHPYTGGLWLLPFMTCFVVFCSYSMALLIKKLASKYSSHLIGW
ncbi:acyltransferase [Desulfobulbus rhabdoformis]|uniref:acyltransferase family protein n=1 Tax=Desulfobulbus rhabdoformis TaxID=34032 RepID=UPI0019652145|nr:acyltransferase [Desulfobulbus rhabdoformis]MBM9614832.1 acyltransferase [Desulfobulbus rhabdoformis]